MLSEISQAEEDKYRPASRTGGIEKSQARRSREQRVT